jgi:hypothetical protein
MSDYDVEDWDNAEYGDQQQDIDQDQIEIENAHVEGEDMLKSQPEEALKKFQFVVTQEAQREQQNYSFSALKYTIVLQMQLG